jgi:hypothetical protein
VPGLVDDRDVFVETANERVRGRRIQGRESRN